MARYMKAAMGKWWLCETSLSLFLSSFLSELSLSRSLFSIICISRLSVFSYLHVSFQLLAIVLNFVGFIMIVLYAPLSYNANDNFPFSVIPYFWLFPAFIPWLLRLVISFLLTSSPL